MPPNHFESEVESFLEGSHGDRTHIKRADHHTVTPLCGTLLQTGGNALHEAPTRQRHTLIRFHVVQNPHQCRPIEQSCQAGRKTLSPQRPPHTNSHVISDGHLLITRENVAIPTIYIHSSKYHQGNYVRNCLNP